MTVLTYKEITDHEALHECNFTAASGGKVRRQWLVDSSPSNAQLQAAIQEIIGYTRQAPGDGRLQRTLPLADPQFPWLYATSVTIRGIGGYGQIATANSAGPLEAPTFPQYTQYDTYRLVTEFSALPFPVQPDAAVQRIAGQWFNFGGVRQTYTYCNEWIRYTILTPKPKADSITGQQGQMAFQAVSVPVGYPNPDGQQYAAKPRMFLPDQSLQVQWFGVPLRYIYSPNSYIAGAADGSRYWQGCINQNAWNGYPPGSLLYLGFDFRPYTSPVQHLSVLNNGNSAVVTCDKLCDITLTFLRTARSLRPGEVVSPPSNPNYVQAGWNLQPWLTDRGFHYATTLMRRFQGDLQQGSTVVNNVSPSTNGLIVGMGVTGPGIPANTTIAAIAANSVTLSQAATISQVKTPLVAGAVPRWYSFPLELLFWDPDVPAGAAPITNY